MSLLLYVILTVMPNYAIRVNSLLVILLSLVLSIPVEANALQCIDLFNHSKSGVATYDPPIKSPALVTKIFKFLESAKENSVIELTTHSLELDAFTSLFMVKIFSLVENKNVTLVLNVSGNISEALLRFIPKTENFIINKVALQLLNGKSFLRIETEPRFQATSVSWKIFRTSRYQKSGFLISQSKSLSIETESMSARSFAQDVAFSLFQNVPSSIGSTGLGFTVSRTGFTNISQSDLNMFYNVLARNYASTLYLENYGVRPPSNLPTLTLLDKSLRN